MRETSTPSSRGLLTGEELGFVEALGVRAEQGLSLHDLVDGAMKREYKSGLLVASATVKGFEDP